MKQTANLTVFSDRPIYFTCGSFCAMFDFRFQLCIIRYLSVLKAPDVWQLAVTKQPDYGTHFLGNVYRYEKRRIVHLNKKARYKDS